LKNPPVIFLFKFHRRGNLKIRRFFGATEEYAGYLPFFLAPEPGHEREQFKLLHK